jgi:hypothetical protein
LQSSQVKIFNIALDKNYFFHFNGRVEGQRRMWIKLIMVSISFCLVLSMTPNKIVNAEEIVQPDPVITVTAVGDIMMGTDYPSPKLPGKDGKFLFEASKEILGKVDIVFGNLKGPLYEQGFPAKKMKDGESYVFRTPPGYVKNLVDEVLMPFLSQTITREILDIRGWSLLKKSWMPKE